MTLKNVVCKIQLEMLYLLCVEIFWAYFWIKTVYVCIFFSLNKTIEISSVFIDYNKPN